MCVCVVYADVLPPITANHISVGCIKHGTDKIR